MGKFLGIVTSDELRFTLAYSMAVSLFPAYNVIETPVTLESEADTINLHDGILIRIKPDDELDGYENVDATIDPSNQEELYYLLENLATTLCQD